MSSTCYAVDYTDFELPIEFFESLTSYINSTASNYESGATISITALELKTYYDNNIKNNLKNQFLNLGADERNLQILIWNNHGSTTWANKYCYIYFLSSNNTINNIENKAIYNIQNNMYAVSNYSSVTNVYNINIRNSDISSGLSGLQDYSTRFRYSSADIDLENITLRTGPWFGVNQKPLNIVNLKPKGQNSYINFFLENYYDINPVEPEPEEPSGDVGAGTGTITNPSGEITGQIDLSGIENGIKNIKDTISGEGEVIRDTISGESEKIVNAINGANESYWGSGEDLTGEQQEEEIEQNINNLMEDISGELTNSEIMQQLERSRSRIFRIF